MNEQTMAAARTKLYSSVISDVLDSFGNMQHAMLPSVRPLNDDSVLFGRARTGLYTALYHADPGDNPYAVEMALIDDLKPSDVVVLACPPSDRICPWGELLSTFSCVQALSKPSASARFMYARKPAGSNAPSATN